MTNQVDENDLVYRLRKRAEIRRQIPTRKSVQENQPDRIADLLEEAATEIEHLQNLIQECITICESGESTQMTSSGAANLIRQRFSTNLIK